MALSSGLLAEIVYVVVVVCWILFGVIFFVGKKGAAGSDTKRATSSLLGLVLQCMAYAAVWVFPRPRFTGIFPLPRAAEAAVATATMAIALGSIWFCLVAVRTLGRQWALEARVIEGHELVTLGPYSVVRNPIYLGMFGLLVATGLAISHWQALVAATVLFLAGNEIRIRSEEKLLREAFGAQFEDYARRVPAFFPRLF
jgi:protein-S-isoprenylcysteine O-methyltransferase Ste14